MQLHHVTVSYQYVVAATLQADDPEDALERYARAVIIPDAYATLADAHRVTVTTEVDAYRVEAEPDGRPHDAYMDDCMPHGWNGQPLASDPGLDPTVQGR